MHAESIDRTPVYAFLGVPEPRVSERTEMRPAEGQSLTCAIVPGMSGVSIDPVQLFYIQYIIVLQLYIFLCKLAAAVCKKSSQSVSPFV